MPHPYSSTIPGLTRTIEQLRSVFPGQVTADTLRKWSIASNNEGPVLLVLRFLGLISEEGQKQPEPAKVFLEHDDAAFASKFEGVVRNAYAKLFETWGDKAWALDRDKLIAFFRNEDETSARVGLQQALTFQALATIAGHGPPPAEAKTAGRGTKRANNSSAKSGSGKAGRDTQARRDIAEPVGQAASRVETTPPPPPPAPQPALTVRIEINLPVSDSQDVYDKIFRSIRANLLNDQPPT